MVGLLYDSLAVNQPRNPSTLGTPTWVLSGRAFDNGVGLVYDKDVMDNSEVRVRFFETEIMGLDLLCRDLGMSRSEVIRHAVSNMLARSMTEGLAAGMRRKLREVYDQEVAKLFPGMD